MKKILGIVLVIACICATASAETFFVSISDDHGRLALANEAVIASDLDGNGEININEVLFAAHEQAYPGGAAAGYEALDMGYGLSMNRLWGVENGGSYGYYVDNASAFSLLDPIADGASLYAYAFTDLENWSDTFCFFNVSVVEAADTVELILSAQSFDADWNPVCIPVEGAIITINGVDTEYRTDAEGKVTIELTGEEQLISARSETMTLVPPVCKVEAK